DVEGRTRRGPRPARSQAGLSVAHRRAARRRAVVKICRRSKKSGQGSGPIGAAGTLRTVQTAGSSAVVTSSQVTGIATGAPGRARDDQLAIAVAVRSLRR